MRGTWATIALFSTFAMVTQVVACKASPELANSPIGASAYSDKVTCKVDADCATGETCGSGVCQMKRCAEASYKSHSPLGAVGFFAHHRELVTVAGTDVASFDPDGGAFKALVGTGFSSGSGSIVDATGGNLLGSRPESVAYVTQGSQMVQVRTGTTDSGFFSVGFTPIAVAAADVDADEQDDVVAVSSDGKVAACNAKTKTCTQTTANPPDVPDGPTGAYTILDAAAGDVDADGYAEAILLTSRKSVLVVNFDAAKTGNAPVVERALPDTLTRIAAGDLDGDGKDDVVGVHDGTTGDSLLVLVLDGPGVNATARQTLDTSNGSLDVAIGTFGSRKQTELALLRSDDSVEMFAAGATGMLSSEYRGPVGATGMKRLAAVDTNGDSPARKVVSATPKLVQGTVVPVAVLTLPPYSRTHSDGTSSVEMGHETSESTTRTDGTIFGVEAGIGFDQEVSVFAKALEVDVNAHYRQEFWREKESTSSVSTSATFSIEAKPENDGYGSGAVVLGCGCFHQYEYELEDPAQVLGPGADGKRFSLYVPVAADTSVWSTRRYNAMVKALGDAAGLPSIDLTYQLGQVASYPDDPRTLDGNVIAAADMVFTKPPTLRVSDIAETSFELSVEHEEVQRQTRYQEVGAEVSVGIFGVTATGSVDLTTEKGYEIGVSESTSFAGTVPPLRNDPTTPEDELALYGYSFTPLVYRHHYDKGSFFVLTYAVGK